MGQIIINIISIIHAIVLIFRSINSHIWAKCGAADDSGYEESNHKCVWIWFCSAHGLLKRIFWGFSQIARQRPEHSASATSEWVTLLCETVLAIYQNTWTTYDGGIDIIRPCVVCFLRHEYAYTIVGAKIDSKAAWKSRKSRWNTGCSQNQKAMAMLRVRSPCRLCAGLCACGTIYG